MTEKNPFYGATFAERQAAREATGTKAVDADETEQVENKAVAPKKTTRKTAKKD